MSGTASRARVALVTGAARNIGQAIAVRLAEAGCDVVVHAGRDPAAGTATADLVRATGRQAAVVAGDLSDPAAALAAVEAAAAAFGRLDILVNNAAIRPEAPFAELPYADWRAVMGIGLDAPFLVSQAALPHLRRGTLPAIVHIGGLTGHTGAENRAHVITAKAGLIGLTKAMAQDLAAEGITVNCVSPGLIETRRDTPAPAHHGHRRNPLGRRGTPEEVAEAVAFLCGPGARYMTGQTLHPNGGAFMP